MRCDICDETDCEYVEFESCFHGVYFCLPCLVRHLRLCLGRRPGEADWVNIRASVEIAEFRCRLCEAPIRFSSAEGERFFLTGMEFYADPNPQEG